MSLSPFSEIPLAPADPILGLTEAFLSDKNPNKVNLGVGVYQNDQGKVPVLDVVREAERLWSEREDSKGYLPIDGAPSYRGAVQRLLFGKDSPLVSAGRVVTAQALGGTGALKLGADFLKRFSPGSSLLLSRPSWENHRALFEAAGLTVHDYPYYDPETHGVDFAGMRSAIAAAAPGSIVLLHACCHNPTGVDLSPEHFGQLASLCAEKRLIPFVDFAYQGFARGITEDAFAVRAFAESGAPFLIASSFSKSFSLYRERVGALSLVTADADESKRVLSQLKRVIRTNYSNPASHGAQIVALILEDPALNARWEGELTQMRERIHRMRQRFVELLAKNGIRRDFSFIQRQAGMFSYSGLPLDKVRRLRSDFGLYIVDSGRICVAALNDKNLDYVTSSIAQVLHD